MKITLKYILMLLYYFSAFFVFGLVIYIVMGFMFLHEFYLPSDKIFSTLVKSMIAATAITLAAIVFNLIDKFNARKKPPSDPE
jgi:lysylphosphatidylglycerol synthetase-like protein (DUF2156 family)